MKAIKGRFARKLASRTHQQQPSAPATDIPVKPATNPSPAWDATRFRVQLKMARNRIDIQRGKKDNEVQAIRIVIADHLRSHKETLARIQADRILRERTQITAFDVIDTYIQLLQTQNNVLSVQHDFDAAPQDLKENVASVVFASFRLNIPELHTVCSMLRDHFGPAVIDPLRNLSGPHIKYINKTLAISLEGGTPDGYLVLEELSSIATEHNVNWIPPPEDIHLDQASGSRPSDPGYYRPQRFPQPANIPGMTNSSAPPPMNIPGHDPNGNMPYGGVPSAPPPPGMPTASAPPPPGYPNPSAPPFDPSAGAQGTLYPFPNSHAQGHNYIPPPPSGGHHSQSGRNDRGPGGGDGAVPNPPSFLDDDALQARFRDLKKK
ncbi:IST1-like protein [Gracilariopsis chorda]|uniref:IST1-like protein n=1 Tax=Gracilariopsis chorda TaxID=448386 RepID=A0A2V3J1I4_9FLOR|nr:IST1-like protein [Gracilariopsis chorda]|eukprot:PXF48248.1 IST1-like protein [Gracilariopsis chorda]